jgi:pimeloyl-ACP methyl ester carboxylesterase
MAKGSTLLLVHGAWCGGWVWQPVVDVLRGSGMAVEVIEQLPSAGPDGAELGGLDADVDCVRARLSALGDSVVVCGHSYAGVLMTELADHPAIARSIYLAAFWPAEGQSLLGLVGGVPPDWIVGRDDGSLAITEDVARAHQVLFGDLDADRAAATHERLASQSAASFLAPSGAATRSHPATYVLCTEDHAVPPPLQEAMAARAEDVVRLQSAHFAQLSRPRELAELLSAAVDRSPSAVS